MPSMFSTALPSTQLPSLLLLISANSHLLTDLGSSTPDTPLWKFHHSHFTPNSFYSIFKTNPTHCSDLRLIWKLKAPPRMIVFAWQMLQGRIPTQDVLQKRGWHLANRCPLCASALETVLHISQDCPFFISVCQQVYQLANVANPARATTASLLQSLVPDRKQRELLLITCFTVWRERCSRIFSSASRNASAIAEDSLFEWGVLNARSLINF
ncbi:hypothetical protein LUZ61_005003 [Rhynchospora tenuis]|uniref:Reverse transcriptase zinc-binding domain-containing protein n=1 Tax=Rhynchospora tenuis TaxID=198213 RepID=A0AAD5ZNY9_9POAL|nr:hypothetical protein LUZ61_005003 [Rhynchospora tenuis]